MLYTQAKKKTDGVRDALQINRRNPIIMCGPFHSPRTERKRGSTIIAIINPWGYIKQDGLTRGYTSHPNKRWHRILTGAE